MSNCDKSEAPSRLVIFMGLVPILYPLMFPLLRPLGVWPLLFVIAASAIFIIRSTASPKVGFPYFLFVAYATVLLLLSLARLMPAAWTVMFSYEAAIRQYIWVPMWFMIYASYYVFLKLFFYKIFKNSFKIFLVTYLISRLSRFFMLSEADYWKRFTFYTFTSDNVIVLFCLFLFISSFKQRNAAIPYLGLLIFLSSSAQSILVSGLMFLSHSIRLYRLPFAFTVFCLGLFLILAPFYTQELFELDANSAVRAIFWRDASEAAASSNYFGVGFGTESIRNDFSSVRSDGWTLIDTNERDIFYVSTHSTFYDVIFRLGLPGLIMVLLIFLNSWIKIVTYKGQFLTVVFGMSLILFTSNAVNVGTASINFLFGTCLCFAVIDYFHSEKSGNRS